MKSSRVGAKRRTAVHAKGLAAGLVGLFVNPWKN